MYEAKEVAGYRYMIEPQRRRRMEMVRAFAEARGLDFSCCREGMPELNTAPCDGQRWIAASSKQ